MNERATKEYWDAVWESERDLPATFDPGVGGVRGIFRRSFHRFFVDALGPHAKGGGSLLEVGCGRSQLLPYFAKAFGLRVAGLDYSAVGCEKARRILAREGVCGEICQGDLFTYSFKDRRRFDIVFSFGLVEHFEDTVTVVRALARFARPGGVVLTIVPNMRGLVGLAQRALDRAVYDLHVPLSTSQLRTAHEQAGLAVVRSGYLLPAHFAVINPGTRAAKPGVARATRNAVYLSAVALSTAMLWISERLVRIPESSSLSPYVVTLATLPAEPP